MVRAVIGGVCLVIAVVVAGCAGPSTDSANAMEIELDAFSGRPNPKWFDNVDCTRELQNAPRRIRHGDNERCHAHLL